MALIPRDRMWQTALGTAVWSAPQTLPIRGIRQCGQGAQVWIPRQGRLSPRAQKKGGTTEPVCLPLPEVTATTSSVGRAGGTLNKQEMYRGQRSLQRIKIW